MKQLVTYFPDADQLDIWWTNGPAGGGGEDVAEGVTLFYDEDDKIVGLTISGASKRANVQDLLDNPDFLGTAIEPLSTIYSVTSLAEEWKVQERTLRRTIETMRAAGEEVGIQQAANHTIMLREADVEKIKAWRVAHPRGRPKAEERKGVPAS